MNNIAILTILSVSLLTLSSCGKKTSDKSESLTGWKANDETGWYFSGEKAPKQGGGPGMVFVEGGTFTKGQTKDNVLHDWNNTPSRQQVRSFYISETEVTNHDYKMYLAWLRLFFDPKIKDYSEIYRGALPDTMVWRNKLSSQELFVENYFRDPAFDYYPIVGVNWLQANNYTEWLTDRVNEKKLMAEGIIDKDMYVFEWSDKTEFSNSNPAFYHKRYKEMGTNMFGEESNIFTDHKKANESTSSDKKGFLGLGKKKHTKIGSYKTYNQKWKATAKVNSKAIAPYRLPTESEWEYAALALMKNREYNRYKGKIIPEQELRQKRGRDKGDFIANIKRGRGDYSGIGGWQNDGYAITSPVKKFKPNDLGLYGMFGNVSEWTADVYRPIIDDEASDFNYYRGNSFKKTIRTDGVVEIVGVDIKYDTLDDGRMVYRSLPGQVREEVYDEAKNYRDGDLQTLLDPYQNLDEEGNPLPIDTDSEFNNPKRNFIVTEDGRVVLQKDNTDVSTDISDKNRVIKGGSWNDRAYWMDPAQRRYMMETESANWVGFRVAHDRLGSDYINNRSARSLK
ncbi:MAG: gliding motility lipoprotein GldJ [Flavobacteriales bacterium]